MKNETLKANKQQGIGSVLVKECHIEQATLKTLLKKNTIEKLAGRITC